jgi:perosamine synthetase
LNREEKYTALCSFIRSAFNQPEESIPMHEPRFLGNEKAYLANAIDSTFISSFGEYIDRFESMMCSITGAKHAIATVNGTAALHVALLLAGVQKDEEVITQALTFVATANAINYCGASPIFLDVDRSTLGLSPDSLRDFLSKNTIVKDGTCVNRITGKRIAAVVPMHTFGHPARIQEIADICKEYGLSLIEDAAESIGSYFKNRHTGTFGLLGVFSFNGNKTVTCGGGGAIVTDSVELAKKAKHITTTAKAAHAWEYYHDMLGFNYRMPNINAAIACAQLEQLESYLENKRQLASEYSAFCKGHDLAFVHEPEDCSSNFWLNAIFAADLDERNYALTLLNEKGIMCRPIWTLLYKLPMYSNCHRDDQQNAEWFESRVVNIPSSVRL